MKKSRPGLLVLSFLALLLSACGSVAPASWPGISTNPDGSTVYVAYNQFLYALQADNGTERWRFPTKLDRSFSVFSAPVLSNDGKLMFGAYNKIFYNIDPGSGATNWTFPGATNRYIASPLITDDTIFAPNADGKLYALDNNGGLRWAFPTDQPLWGQPVSDGQHIYITSLNHSLYALDAKSGTELWSKDLEGTLVNHPVLNEGALYVGTLNSEVIALDSGSGAVLWRSTTEGWVWGSPTFYKGKILAGDLDGKVYAFDAASGKKIWSLDTQGAITGAPLVVNEHIYVVNEQGKVLSISLDGRSEWTKTFEAKLYGSPVSVGDLLLISEISKDGIAIALKQNGDVAWTYLPK